MPIHACTLPNGSSGFQWGKSGKCYASRKDAEAQATAIYASGWKEKLLKSLRKGDVDGHEFHGNQYQTAFGTNDPYVYHLTSSKDMPSFYRNGIKPSTTGYSGKGVYMANTPSATEYHDTLKSGTLLRINKEALVAEHGLYNYRTNQSGRLQFDEHTGEILLTGGHSVRPEFIEVKRPTGWEKIKSARKINLHSLLFKQQDLDHAAHDAATSPHNLKRPPTEAEAKAGNYPKGHVRFAGLDVSIENPAGSRRRPEWPPMQAHYGYVKGTEGADGDHVDCFLRPATPLDWDGTAYVIDQVNADGGFDEHKILLGWDSQGDAEKAYLSHYPKGWPLGNVTAMSLDDLKEWLEGDTTEPLAKEDGGGAASTTTTGHTQSSSPTSGLTAYGMIRHQKKRIKLYPKEKT